jgi:hypothetical protein
LVGAILKILCPRERRVFQSKLGVSSSNQCNLHHSPHTGHLGNKNKKEYILFRTPVNKQLIQDWYQLAIIVVRLFFNILEGPLLLRWSCRFSHVRSSHKFTGLNKEAWYVRRYSKQQENVIITYLVSDSYKHVFCMAWQFCLPHLCHMHQFCRSHTLFHGLQTRVIAETCNKVLQLQPKIAQVSKTHSRIEVTWETIIMKLPIQKV